MTADQLQVAVGGETAATLADLISVRKDLEEAQVYVRQLQAIPASTHQSSEHKVMRPALWKAVAISYRRAFTTGKSFTKGRPRSRYPADIIESLGEADRAAHPAILKEADTHVAHRVDDDREGPRSRSCSVRLMTPGWRACHVAATASAGRRMTSCSRSIHSATS